MAKGLDLKEFFLQNTEMKFDSRLLDKKVIHGFLTREERETYLKQLAEEKDFDFTTAETLDKD